MRDWRLLAEGLGLEPAEVERVAPALDALESAFRPLAGAIPYEAEPATVFQVSPGEQP